MAVKFKKVPALEKGFGILDLIARQKKPLGISEISEALHLHKSTVFNILHTLSDLGVLENTDNKFTFGTKLYMLGKASERGSDLIRTVHPFLEEIRRKTELSAFLCMRSGSKAVVLDKADSAFGLKISSEVGIAIPLLAGAHGKALLSQLPDHEIDAVLAREELRAFTRFSCADRDAYRDMVLQSRRDGVAVDREEYIEGIRGLAVPLNMGRKDLQVAILALGLKNQIEDHVVPSYARLLKDVAKRIEERKGGRW